MSEQRKIVDDELVKAKAELDALVKSKEWQIAKAAVDAAGVADPTPISDGIGTVMSLAEGDLIGAGLSAISLIPYLGDAVAKTAKGARAIKKLKELTELIARATKKVDQLNDKYRRTREAARRVREARRKAVGSVEECARQGKWGPGRDMQLPTRGTWNPANSKGHGKWTSDDGRYTVEYKEGYPDFTTAKGPPGSPVFGGKVEIEMTGNNGKDFPAADKEYKRIYKKDTPDGYTWHHTEDGVTMHLVRTDVHDKSVKRGGSGAAHAGGGSLVKSTEF